VHMKHLHFHPIQTPLKLTNFQLILGLLPSYLVLSLTNVYLPPRCIDKVMQLEKPEWFIIWNEMSTF
jgi:hypothetical protein